MTTAATGAALRAEVFAGRVLLLAATDASRALVDRARVLVARALGLPATSSVDNLLDDATALAARDTPALLGRLAAARAAIAEDAALLGHARALAAVAGVPGSTVIDRPRLRGVTPDAHRVPAARAAFFAHRDTWYANPRAQLNWWTPLHAVDGRASFGFHLDAFGRPVENSSERFDHARFVAEVGWQRRPDAPPIPADTYPAALDDAELGATTPIVADAAETVLFSAAHVHRTLPNTSGRVRLSIDFRTVALEDVAAGRGAPDPDNRSTGSTLVDYLAP